MIKTIQDCEKRAKNQIQKILKNASGNPKLRRLGPGQPWRVTVQFVNRPAMTRLNRTYRGKAYPTDILSFPAGTPFIETGLLGELVICLPILRFQAKERKHTPEIELDVLLVHGILHLLGFDHEKSRKQSAEMARWELYLLTSLLPSRLNLATLGLIDRTGSSI